jgi:DNA-directed RNA polymerase specialized sigma24 family protein
MLDSDSLTAGDRLLLLFDSDPTIAAEKLSRLKEKLILRFSAERCYDPENLANEAVARLLALIDKDPERVVTNIGAFLYGFATNIIHESRRSPILHEVPLDHMAAAQEPRTTPLDELLVALSEDESLSSCLKQCLKNLDAPDRQILLAYYDAEDDEKLKRSRKRLALSLGVTSSQLRKHALKLRKTLKASINECLACRNKTHKSS